VNRSVHQGRRRCLRRVVPLEHTRQRGLAQFVRTAEHAGVSDLTLGIQFQLEQHIASDGRGIVYWRTMRERGTGIDSNARIIRK
jgi:hypothetical protein